MGCGNSTSSDTKNSVTKTKSTNPSSQPPTDRNSDKQSTETGVVSPTARNSLPNLKTESSTARQLVNISAATFVRTKIGGLDPEFYREGEKIGSGAFSEVKRCLHIPTGQLRAVKIIYKAGLHNEQIDERLLLNEIKILRTLDHPNILRCLEMYEDRLKYYLITELCEGGELFNRIVQLRHFSEMQAAEVMSQLLSTIAYCHSKNVIHRDIKPENLLLEDRSSALNIKVADFGSSTIMDATKKMSGCFGSAYYLAPEVLNGSYNEKCDVWSCGVILYIMLTGRPPYSGRTESEIIRQVRNSPLKIVPEQLQLLSSDAIDILQKLLTIDVSVRISAAEALQHPWITNYKRYKDAPNLTSALEALREFNNTIKLRQAVHIYIATQIITREEAKHLAEAFRTIDKNGDGRLSKLELWEQFSMITGAQQASLDVESIFTRLDTDNSGFIDYTQFLNACMENDRYKNKKNLELAFRMFDRDENGTITATELKEVLSDGGMMDDLVWNELINEVDTNGDGMIDIREFYTLMTSKL
jgi:calcium-dependent protein kinase